jgi:hypothetical protein
MLHYHGAELAHYVLANEQQPRGVSILWQGSASGHSLEGTAHAEMDVQDHGIRALPEEVEQVLAVALDAHERPLVDCLCA